jgi:hypothetical protein
MQSAAGIGAEAHDIAGIRRDFRLVEYDFEHGAAFQGKTSAAPPRAFKSAV